MRVIVFGAGGGIVILTVASGRVLPAAYLSCGLSGYFGWGAGTGGLGGRAAR
jgi:hypothetical protein